MTIKCDDIFFYVYEKNEGELLWITQFEGCEKVLNLASIQVTYVMATRAYIISTATSSHIRLIQIEHMYYSNTASSYYILKILYYTMPAVSNYTTSCELAHHPNQATGVS